MALKPLNSVGGFSVGESPNNVIFPNGDFSGNKANFTGNIAASGLLTDNLFYANGERWDLQEAAGATGQLQFNTGNDFDASANLVFDSSLNVLTVTGNAVVTNTASIGNLRTDNLLYANGQPWDMQQAAGSNNQIQFNIDGDFSASANLTYDDSSQEFTVIGNAILSGILTDNYYYANGAPVDFQQAAGANGQIQFNDDGDFGSSVNLTYDVANGELVVDGTLDVSGNASLGGILTDNYYYANGAPVDFQQAAGANNQIQFNSDNDFGASANLTFNPSTDTLTTINANITTVNTSNIVGTGIDIVLDANGFVSTFHGANGLVEFPADLLVTGNINGSNIVGPLANGTSNIRVFNGANVEISVGGSANVGTFTAGGLSVAGDINSTTGNMLANGNVTANGFVNATNANISGQAQVNELKTDNIIGNADGVTITASGADNSINLIPTGNGTVDVNNFKITHVADPVDPTDAANKGYVDALAGEGLVIHTPVRVEAESALTATYTQGGTTPTVDSIANQSDITFTASHGLSVNDGIVFDNTFNGLTAGEAYWVAEVIDATTITVKDNYFNSALSNLTNGTSLAQASRANPGVGATLTNSGANAAITIDGVALSTNDRVLVYTQTNAYENGIYVVTTVGDGSTAWVLTRATDFNKYIPSSPLGVARNSYVFVEQGSTGAGESYVMTQPAGEIIVGTDNLEFTQFSAAGSYTAGDGINITGTSISANTDGITTDIVGGNIVVKASAQLTTPNIGAATGTSLNVTGNVTADSLSIANIANIDLDLTVGGVVDVNGSISSNATVSGLNLTTSGNVSASGNVIANNVIANSTISAVTANVSGNVNSGNVSITNALQGNTATFSGNVVVPNLSINLELSGNTANFTSVTVSEGLNGNTATFTGNIQSLNANLGNLAIANFFTGTLINGTSNIVISPSGNITVTSGANSSFVVTDTGANVVGDFDVTGNISAGDFSTDNLSANTLAINNNVEVGTTDIGWGSVTTVAITANQTIAQFSVTGVTGIEFIVKGVDAAGSKFSVATVTAVTDGTTVDYVTYATAAIGGPTGSLVVNKIGSNVALQVTPSSSNSTVWTAQYRTI